MNKTIVTLALLAVSACPAACAAEPGKAPAKELDPDAKAVVAGNNAFAFDLYARLMGEKGNLFFSPYSVSTALAMTYAGARGDTAAQMAKVLHFDLDQAKLHPAFKTIINGLQAEREKRGYQLSVANALWGQAGFKFIDDFLALTKANYGAGLSTVDFKRDAESARKTINAWVEKQTQDKIKELIQKGILTPDTRLVLVNAIYFKGDWETPFKPANTRKAPFTLADGKTVDVQMMNQKHEFKYMENESFQALELPYAGDELSMVIFLPRKADGLAEFEKSLTASNLAAWTPKLAQREVNVFLPKFRMTWYFRLDKVLPSMGMVDAFDRLRANFSAMTTQEALMIAAVLHKAFVDVDEKGTEAAAATAVIMAPKAAPARAPVFRADHPFAFVIRDVRSGSVLFAGRLSEPEQS